MSDDSEAMDAYSSSGSEGYSSVIERTLTKLWGAVCSSLVRDEEFDGIHEILAGSQSLDFAGQITPEAVL
jgi:hypothetical protein